ncbi:MAG: 50S ribosomal protein L25 [Proteobacteria bacterium]|jgi:large subunit ribosomal protein L25|nr:50S ribosomal protein L25 [Pseudomonadota bacterium]
MVEILIKADRRKSKGKGMAKRVRREGNIPAVLYGKDTEPLPITVSLKEWQRLGKQIRRNIIMKMELHNEDNIENRPVMVKDIQRGFLGDKILHIDFLQVSMERIIEVEIPIHLVGEAKGVADSGIVEQHLRTIMVACLPTQMPEKIEVDITDLGIGDSFHVNQISIPGVKLLEGADVAIVTVTPPSVEEEKPVVVEEVEAEVEKVEPGEKGEKAEKGEKGEKAEKREKAEKAEKGEKREKKGE